MCGGIVERDGIEDEGQRHRGLSCRVGTPRITAVEFLASLRTGPPSSQNVAPCIPRFPNETYSGICEDGNPYALQSQGNDHRPGGFGPPRQAPAASRRIVSSQET